MTEIFQISDETFNKIHDLSLQEKIKVGIIWPWGCIETNEDWVIECDLDDPHFACDPETGEWYEHKAVVKGCFLYRSHELTDEGIDMNITEFGEKEVKTKTKFFKGVLVIPPSKEKKLNAVTITLEEALEKVGFKLESEICMK